MRRFVVSVAAAAMLVSAGASAQTLKAVKERGSVSCGVSQGLPGFSARDDKGNWSGFDVDLCRAVAAAVFNDVGKAQYVPLSATERFEALKSGKIDLLSRNTTWTLSREASLGLNFAAVTYFDGQGFLLPGALKLESALELADKSVCAQTGTTTIGNLAEFFGSNRMKYKLVELATVDDLLKAYSAGNCDVLTSDVSQLFALRSGLPKPGDHVVLPDIVSKEPLGPAVRQGDAQWLNIVKWTHFAMLNGEELGVSSATLDQALRSEKAAVRRLVGTEGNSGEQMGLTKDWAARIIRLVGNYDEVFERNIGTGSPLGIPRGLNNLWTNGGIQYAPPID
jgi:general L-amino acid transport system substrate-binding protein